MPQITININEMTEAQSKACLKQLVKWLDELDLEDYFGSEGWKHQSGLAE